MYVYVVHIEFNFFFAIFVFISHFQFGLARRSVAAAAALPLCIPAVSNTTHNHAFELFALNIWLIWRMRHD